MPHPVVPRNTTLLGDCRETLRALPDASVQTIITSPPYYALRDYHVDGQIGLEDTLDAYVRALCAAFAEAYRVLRPDGTMWVNLGDAFADDSKWGGSTGGRHAKALHGKSGVGRAKRSTGIGAKNLMGVPWLVAFALQGRVVYRVEEIDDLCRAIDDGDLDALRAWAVSQRFWREMRRQGWRFTLRSDIVWSKSNSMPESVTDRPSRSHELLFLFAKSNAPTFWTHRTLPGTRRKPKPDYVWMHRETREERRERPDDAATATLADGKTKAWARVNLWRSHDYFYDADAIREEHTALGRRPGNKSRFYFDRDPKHDNLHRMRPDDAHSFHPLGRNKRSVWDIATQPRPEGHYATFPERLVEPCVLAGAPSRCCETCGAPWFRESVASFLPQEDVSRERGMRTPEQYDETSSWPGTPRGSTLRTPLDWRPTCDCGDTRGDGRALVLDLFGGTGTTGKVALRHGRDYLLCELSDAYVALSDDYLGDEVQQTIWSAS